MDDDQMLEMAGPRARARVSLIEGLTEAGTAAGALPLFLLDVDEVVGVLGVGRSFVYTLLRTGELRSCKLGARTKIPATAVLGYVQRRLAAADAEQAAVEVEIDGRRARR
jgi:excisionase family DNA binding protein